MITINSLKLDDITSKIDVDVSTTPGNIFTEVKVWSYLQTESDAFDVSELLAQVSENEIFAIPAELLEVEDISGLYFVKFETDEIIVPTDCNADNNTSTGIVANLLPYYECVLNKVLAINIIGCKESIVENCSDCTQNTYDLDMYLNGLKFAISYGYYEEGIRLMKILDEECEVCNTCPSYGDSLLVNGTGYGVENNTIILI